MSKKLPPGIKVMPSCCATCPFKEVNGHDQDQRIADAVRTRVLGGDSQLCHSTPGGTPGAKIGPKTKLCRGGRDFALELFHRIGIIEAPTDDAWSKKQMEIKEENKRKERLKK